MYPKHYFDLFREDIVEGTVFVGMDFGTRFLSRRKDIIEAGIVEAGFRPIIVDTSHYNESILMDILRGVQESLYWLVLWQPVNAASYPPCMKPQTRLRYLN